MVFVEDLIVSCHGNRITDFDGEGCVQLALYEESCYCLSNVSHDCSCDSLISAGNLHGHAHFHLSLSAGIDDDETAFRVYAQYAGICQGAGELVLRGLSEPEGYFDLTQGGFQCLAGGGILY